MRNHARSWLQRFFKSRFGGRSTADRRAVARHQDEFGGWLWPSAIGVPGIFIWVGYYQRRFGRKDKPAEAA